MDDGKGPDAKKKTINIDARKRGINSLGPAISEPHKSSNITMLNFVMINEPDSGRPQFKERVNLWTTIKVRIDRLLAKLSANLIFP